MVTECPENYINQCKTKILNMLDEAKKIHNKTDKVLHIKNIYELVLSEYYSQFIMKYPKLRTDSYKQLLINIKEIEELENLDEIKNNNPNILDFFYNAKSYMESLGILEA